MEASESKGYGGGGYPSTLFANINIIYTVGIQKEYLNGDIKIR